MRKYTVILLLSLFAFGLTAQSNKDMLCKKWKIDVEALMASMPAEMKAMMDIATDEQKAMMEASMKQMGELEVEFFKNGTMQTSSKQVQGQFDQGTWEFIDNGQAIKSFLEKDGKETILDIQDLTSSSLTVKERGKEKDPAISFIPKED